MEPLVLGLSDILFTSTFSELIFYGFLYTLKLEELVICLSNELAHPPT